MKKVNFFDVALVVLYCVCFVFGVVFTHVNNDLEALKWALIGGVQFVFGTSLPVLVLYVMKRRQMTTVKAKFQCWWGVFLYLVIIMNLLAGCLALLNGNYLDACFAVLNSGVFLGLNFSYKMYFLPFVLYSKSMGDGIRPGH